MKRHIERAGRLLCGGQWIFYGVGGSPDVDDLCASCYRVQQRRDERAMDLRKRRSEMRRRFWPDDWGKLADREMRA